MELRLTQPDLDVLAQELHTDPVAMGYATLYPYDAARLLDQTPAPASLPQLVLGDALPTTVLVQCVHLADLAHLKPYELTYLTCLLTPPSLTPLDPAYPAPFDALPLLFPPDTPTYQALLAAAARPASRAEVLFGPHVILTEE